MNDKTSKEKEVERFTVLGNRITKEICIVIHCQDDSKIVHPMSLHRAEEVAQYIFDLVQRYKICKSH